MKAIHDLQKVLDASEDRPTLLFKHSNTCPISAKAYQEIEKFSALYPRVSIFILVVQESRELSQKIEKSFGIKHESPQAIVLFKQVAIANESHYTITEEFLLKNLLYTIEGSWKIYDSIIDLLDAKRIPYHLYVHEPTPKSEDSARVRGVPLEYGGKALVLKVSNDYRLFVLPGSKKLSIQKIKENYSKKVRFATPDELHTFTGLVPGSVPPFGNPILPFEIVIEQSIVHNDEISFNAGLLTHSITMKVSDYLRCQKAKTDSVIENDA